MYFSRRFYIAMTVIILVMVTGYFVSPLYPIGIGLLLVLCFLIILDFFRLYRHRRIKADRKCADRFSNGDANDVSLSIENGYGFPLKLNITDEVPVIFARRDLLFLLTLNSNTSKTIRYQLTPVKRGLYHFGRIRVFARTSSIGLVVRQFICGEKADVKVYPSFLMLQKYEFLAINNNLTEMGIKRLRRVGQQTEFEQIRDYVKDDDFRLINWKATSRMNKLMVNVYEEERSQQIFNIIDKGRVMQQKFCDMTLLDYSINASLVLSHIAIHKEDRAGMITFAEKPDTYINASKRSDQMQLLLESLYSQQTTFGETDFSSLCVLLSQHAVRRSLMIIYTNFTSFNSMNRQLDYLIQLSRSHRVLVVFFQDSEVEEYISEQPQSMEDYYKHVIAEKTIYEKRLIVSTLLRHGIYSLLTTPQHLSVDVINKYLEMKARQMF
jgi:uncharacterized protein (DUF58 family)